MMTTLYIIYKYIMSKIIYVGGQMFNYSSQEDLDQIIAKYKPMKLNEDNQFQKKKEYKATYSTKSVINGSSKQPKDNYTTSNNTSKSSSDNYSNSNNNNNYNGNNTNGNSNNANGNSNNDGQSSFNWGAPQPSKTTKKPFKIQQSTEEYYEIPVKKQTRNLLSSKKVNNYDDENEHVFNKYNTPTATKKQINQSPQKIIINDDDDDDNNLDYNIDDDADIENLIKKDNRKSASKPKISEQSSDHNNNLNNIEKSSLFNTKSPKNIETMDNNNIKSPKNILTDKSSEVSPISDIPSFYTNNFNVDQNKWYHIALIYKNNGLMKVLNNQDQEVMPKIKLFGKNIKYFVYANSNILKLCIIGCEIIKCHLEYVNENDVGDMLYNDELNYNIEYINYVNDILEKSANNGMQLTNDEPNIDTIENDKNIEDINNDKNINDDNDNNLLMQVD